MAQKTLILCLSLRIFTNANIAEQLSAYTLSIVLSCRARNQQFEGDTESEHCAPFGVCCLGLGQHRAQV